MERQRYCRQCLLRDMKEGEYYQKMFDYISRLPEDDKVSAGEYERRLAICKDCEQLLNGMCRLCGCYVEMRAAIQVRGCPGTTDRWG